MISREGDQLRISGPLTQATVRELFDGGLKTSPQDMLVVDLAGVEAVDSAAVGLLLAWVREARRNNIKLCFSHIPDNLFSLASLYGVADVLPRCTEHSVQA